MATTKDKYKTIMEERKRLLELLLNKEGMNLRELYRQGRQDFINRNLDLLSPEEMQKFSSLFVEGKVVLTH